MKTPSAALILIPISLRKNEPLVMLPKLQNPHECSESIANHFKNYKSGNAKLNVYNEVFSLSEFEKIPHTVKNVKVKSEGLTE